MYDLAEYATASTKGRIHKEEYQLKYRSEFGRDRDRIIHSSAFRRLEYKTQVFINHEGDLFRTRLTHSLEVAQMGRSVACALKLNLELVEAICLAHDLGHTPFGHTGQDALNSALIKAGYKHGFEHNLQSLRVVDVLEERYANFDGLNLTYETREGILKHCSISKAKELGEIGKRFLENCNPSIEAQLANIVDELAYNYHDLDDGLRANLINFEELLELSIIKQQYLLLRKKYPHLKGRRLQKELVRHLINVTIDDLITNSLLNIKKYKVKASQMVRNCPIIISYGEKMRASQQELKKFLHKNMYKHSLIMQLRFKTFNIVTSLYNAYISDIKLLPEIYQEKINSYSESQVVVDYISSMTDRYAFKQYNRLYGAEGI